MRRVIQIPINEQIAYETRIHEAISSLPHGYKKRFFMAILKSLFHEGHSISEMSKRMLKIAEFGMGTSHGEIDNISVEEAKIVPLQEPEKKIVSPSDIKNAHPPSYKMPSLLRGPSTD